MERLRAEFKQLEEESVGTSAVGTEREVPAWALGEESDTIEYNGSEEASFFSSSADVWFSKKSKLSMALSPRSIDI